MSGRTRLVHFAVYLLYLLAAAVITWPLLTVFSSHLLGHPFGDSYEYTRHIWWMNHALRNGLPIFDQPLLAYPAGLDGAWLWGNPLQSFPAWLLAFALPLPAAFNLAALLTLALNGWALYWLVWKLTGGRAAAIIAGVIFMAYPHFQGQLGAGHTGLLVLWPVPLYVWGLLKLLSPNVPPGVQNPWLPEKPVSPLQRADAVFTEKLAPAGKWLLLTALLFVVSLWGSQLLLVYVVVPVTAMMTLWALARRDWRGLARVTVAAGMGGVLALVFFVPVIREALNAPPWLAEGGDVAFSADLLGIITPSFQHPLYGGLPYTHKVLGIDPFERVAYVGIIAGALALVGVVKARVARPWLWLALAAWVLSLGPLLKVLDEVVVLNLGEDVSAVTLPWLLLQKLPVLSITRTPARFNITIGLAVAIMAGYGVSYLSTALLPRRSGFWRAGVVVILALFILFDYQFFWPFPTIAGVVPAPVAALRDDDTVRAVLDVPWAHLLAEKDGMYLQTGHGKPLVGGHVTRRTPVDPAKLMLLQETLDPSLLDMAGADVIVLHKRWDETDRVEALTRARLGEPFYEDEEIAAFHAPEAEEDAGFLWTLGDETLPAQVENALDVYLYAPEPGWVHLTADVRGDGRAFTVLLDRQAVYSGVAEGDTRLSLPLPVTEAGYHTLTLALEPPCPRPLSPALQCRALTVATLELRDYQPVPMADPVRLVNGITLAAAHVPDSATDTLTVGLWWQFDAARTLDDVRFVHVLDENGVPVAQSDVPLGGGAAGESWLDVVEIALEDVPPGLYRVAAGWYRFPEVTPFAREDGAGGVIELGRVEVE